MSKPTRKQSAGAAGQGELFFVPSPPDKSGRRRCELCGIPLRLNNQTGICRQNPECNRERARRARRAQGAKPRSRSTCRLCPAPVKGNGLCSMHNARQKRLGDPGSPEPLRKPLEIHTGDIFGRWTVLADYSRGRKRLPCRCECGTEREVAVGSLSSGKSRSCGCLLRRNNRRSPSDPYMRAGEAYGRLTILKDVPQSTDLALCRCECGAEVKKNPASIRQGTTRSCGCLRRETLRTHGLSGHPLYSTWAGIAARTGNPADSSYANYGGRGITMCERWQGMPEGFKNFIADVGERPPGKTLDRINNDRDYEPENVRWATPPQQTANRRTVAQLTKERDELARLLRLALDALEAE